MWISGDGLVNRHFVFFQAEDGIRDLVRSRGLGDVYKRQHVGHVGVRHVLFGAEQKRRAQVGGQCVHCAEHALSLIHISEPTRPY